MQHMIEIEVINDTYQVAECIKQTAVAFFYHGFHLRMRKEILIAKSQEPLKHNISGMDELPYLPYIIDQYHDGDQYYTILNYVSGVFCEDYILQKREFTEKELISLGLQICDILRECEKRNISATEIWKPDNVMLTPDFKICFLDGSSLLQKDSVKAVSKENLKAAIIFMRFLCQGNKTIISKAVNKDFNNIPQLKKRLLDVIKKRSAYKKIKWKQRILYVVVGVAFMENILLLYKNALSYKEDSLLSAGNLAFQNSEYEQAIIDYQNVLTINPDNIAARRGIAESYWNEGNLEMAEQSFLENINDYQDEIGAVFLLQILEDKALDSFITGNYENAIEYYLKLEDINPNSKYEEMLLNIYLRQNDFEHAKGLIQELRSQVVSKDFLASLDETYQMIERSEEVSTQFCDLADLIIQEDWLALSDKLVAEDFMELCERYGGNTYCRYEGNIFVKLYKNGSIYLGEMEQDERCGQGKLVLIGIRYSNIIIYDGIWSNDLPNGRGTQKAVIVPYLKDDKQKWLSIDGNYINGYSDGELFVQEYEVKGTEKNVLRSVTWKSTLGYLEPLKEYENAEYQEERDQEEAVITGYVIGIWDTGELIGSHYNHIDSVVGLGFRECYFYFDDEVFGDEVTG